nr:uncharacterized protein LOC128697505 [Cherax quadricarinatus]XP_053645219.1 uncharacterized protein LOC128697505 [Cherax quadricarinatus]
MSDFDGKWLREASKVEKIFEECHKRGILLIAYHVSLSTRVPLQEDQVRLALKHLYRKVPCLRVCFGEREGTLWFREATNNNVDFKVLPETEVNEVMACLKSYQYNSDTGPLWCTRLVADTSSGQCEQTTSMVDNISSGHSGQASPHIPDDNLVSFPHSYHLFLGFHHSIVDGFSAMKICGFTVTLLNDVITGKPINDDQLGEFVSREETMELVLAKKALIEADPLLMKKLTDEANLRKDKELFFSRIYQIPEGIEVKSLILERQLDTTTTRKFLNKCRAERVTVHSAFTALADAALVELMAEKDAVQDTYNIYNYHSVNMRRYWKGDVSKSLGCHVSVIFMNTHTPRNINEIFWDFARSVHQELQSKLKSGSALEEEAFDLLKSDSMDTFEAIADSPSGLVLPDYNTTNMGDVTALVTEGTDHIRVTRVIRSISNTVLACTHVFHTFRGRFLYLLDYSTRHLSTEIAESFCNKIFDNLLNVIQDCI